MDFLVLEERLKVMEGLAALIVEAAVLLGAYRVLNNVRKFFLKDILNCRLLLLVC